MKESYARKRNERAHCELSGCIIRDISTGCTNGESTGCIKQVSCPTTEPQGVHMQY